MKSLAVLSLHTSPLAQPGTGDGGGLNVYVRELATAMAHQGIQCDIYTRRTSAVEPEVVDVEPGVRVIQIMAGAFDLPKEALSDVVPAFTEEVARHLVRRPVDAIHAHYWLSAVAGHDLKHRLDIPLAVTFHTLGRVKHQLGDPEPADRILAEERVIGCADAVFASGEVEAQQLVEFYDVGRERIEILTPGVDLAFFSPGQRWAARQAVGLGEQPVVLFVGRLQPLKGADLAIEALAQMKNDAAVLVIVGGPSGMEGELTLRDLHRRIAAHGLEPRVRFVDPQPHHLLSTYYRSADVCVVPSRSESFGLVALEAAACGTPVVATNVGGLRNNVVHGFTGFLVDQREPAAFAASIDEVLADPLLALRLGEHGVDHAGVHTWSASAIGAVDVFGRLTTRELLSCA